MRLVETGTHPLGREFPRHGERKSLDIDNLSPVDAEQTVVSSWPVMIVHFDMDKNGNILGRRRTVKGSHAKTLLNGLSLKETDINDFSYVGPVRPNEFGLLVFRPGLGQEPLSWPGGSRRAA